MISYELAKELKEAGFVFKPSSGVGCVHSPKICIFEDDERTYLFPTLSELIEACVKIEGTFHLNLGANYAPKGVPWVAGSRRQIVANAHPLPEDKNLEYGFGVTPEEAVARLWLALSPTFPKQNSPEGVK